MQILLSLIIIVLAGCASPQPHYKQVNSTPRTYTDAEVERDMAILNQNMNMALDRVQPSFQYHPSPPILPPFPASPSQPVCRSTMFGNTITTRCY